MTERNGVLTPANHIPTYLVEERRLNEKVRAGEIGFRPGEEIDAVLGGLVGQLPNRIYCGESGNIGRVVFYADVVEGYNHAAYIQTLIPKSESDWENFKKETLIVGSNSNDMESELMRWRTRFGLTHDLVQQPEKVYTVNGYAGSDNVFIHSVMDGQKKISAYYFMAYGLNVPRYIAFRRGENSDITETPQTLLSAPPADILQYANIFSKTQ